MGEKGEELVDCPFNNAHRMPERRLQWHIVNKCKDYQRKQHLYTTCDYNSAHFVLISALEQHRKVCPDKPPDKSEEKDEDWVTEWPGKKRQRESGD